MITSVANCVGRRNLEPTNGEDDFAAMRIVIPLTLLWLVIIISTKISTPGYCCLS